MKNSITWLGTFKGMLEGNPSKFSCISSNMYALVFYCKMISFRNDIFLQSHISCSKILRLHLIFVNSFPFLYNFSFICLYIWLKFDVSFAANKQLSPAINLIKILELEVFFYNICNLCNWVCGINKIDIQGTLCFCHFMLYCFGCFMWI